MSWWPNVLVTKCLVYEKYSAYSSLYQERIFTTLHRVNFDFLIPVALGLGPPSLSHLIPQGKHDLHTWQEISLTSGMCNSQSSDHSHCLRLVRGGPHRWAHIGPNLTKTDILSRTCQGLGLPNSAPIPIWLSTDENLSLERNSYTMQNFGFYQHC